MSKNNLNVSKNNICFGTDGWRGVLGIDFTLEKLQLVAAAAAQELAHRAPESIESRKVIIGYDCRFLAREMAESIVPVVRGCNLEPIISQTPLPTPACSWAVIKNNALGALVITASHNPPEWLGLKIKSFLGGSVDEDFTNDVEKRLLAGGVTIPLGGVNSRIDFRSDHLIGLKEKCDISFLVEGLKRLKLKIFVDPMHGSAAGCIQELLGKGSDGFVEEIRSNPDPLFGGNPPEPIEKYLIEIKERVKQYSRSGGLSIGIVFDGDGDRIAAIDEKGRYCNTQKLMPLLIEHLSRVKGLPGCVIKTVSGSDLMSLVASELGREIKEVPVGFKYIASQMLSREVLIGGEESGGIGFGFHIPERDALFVALLLLEALAYSGKPLGQNLDEISIRFGESYFDRIDLKLDCDEVRNKLELFLLQNTPSVILGKEVKEVNLVDGVKLKIGHCHWLMFRFSGTEPLLRIYCEAKSKEDVNLTLDFGNKLVEDILRDL